MRKALLIVSVAVFGLSFGGGEQAVSTFTDKRDGKVYRIVEADGQFWMAENLNYEAVGSVCYDNKALNCAKYGRLYDEHTAANEACPDGWHLPLGAEWTALENYASGSGMAGKKLKSTSGWKNKGNGTDEYGFSALPGGYGFSGGRFDGKFYFAGSSGFWWGKEDGKYRFASILRRMDFDKDGVDGDIGPKKTLLYYVRCVQDSKEGER